MIIKRNPYTDMGVWYVFSKSLPFRSALTKVGPNAGTRYNVASSANIENPNDVYSAGSGGTGSKSGLTTNHAATGTRPKSKIEGRSRGGGATAIWKRNPGRGRVGLGKATVTK